MTNRLSLARQTLNKTAPTAPSTEAYKTTPPPTTTIQTTTELPQTTSTMSTTTVKLIPYSEETGPFPPLSVTQAALIKVLEEAVRIEHQRREREKVAARQELQMQRPRRHVQEPAASFRRMVASPRCPCGISWHGTRFLGINIGPWKRPRFHCPCKSKSGKRQQQDELPTKSNNTRQASPFGKCPTLHTATKDLIRIPKRIPVPRCFCPDAASSLGELYQEQHHLQLLLLLLPCSCTA